MNSVDLRVPCTFWRLCGESSVDDILAYRMLEANGRWGEFWKDQRRRCHADVPWKTLWPIQLWLGSLLGSDVYFRFEQGGTWVMSVPYASAGDASARRARLAGMGGVATMAVADWGGGGIDEAADKASDKSVGPNPEWPESERPKLPWSGEELEPVLPVKNPSSATLRGSSSKSTGGGVIGTTYYVDPDIGDDSNDGTGSTAGEAWRTLWPVRFLVRSGHVANNTRVLLRRGATWSVSSEEAALSRRTP